LHDNWYLMDHHYHDFELSGATNSSYFRFILSNVPRVSVSWKVVLLLAFEMFCDSRKLDDGSSPEILSSISLERVVPLGLFFKKK
jgi:hypothetical protein